jgi:preprotein translocase subunit SecG
MFAFLLLVHAIIAAALVTVILMQRSEGGGLGMGGSPSGLMSARGAADFLTRATATLASLFVGLSIVLAVLAANHRPSTVDTSLARPAGGAVPAAQRPGPAEDGAAPFSSAAREAAGNGAAPADNASVPLAR